MTANKKNFKIIHQQIQFHEASTLHFKGQLSTRLNVNWVFSEISR